MSSITDFQAAITAGNTFKGDSILLGGALYHGEVPADCQVRVPLRTMNRHGLICGATGSGKTKTMQILSEHLSLKGVPSLLMDVKGDLSGIAAPGTTNEKIEARHAKVGEPYVPQGMPVELLSLSKEPGARLRATVSEFGPVLLGRILELNDTQQSVLALVFKYCDDNGLPLLDLKDLRRVQQNLTEKRKEANPKQYGAVSGATVNKNLRKHIEIEQQGADRFFGERSFDVNDLLATRDGQGVVHIVRLTDIQDRPRLFSTFMLCLLAEIYNTFPEVGDPEKPKLVLFIDEAHLIFSTATKALQEQIETIIKLIRSKGVGVYFCTQDPSDVPEGVLGQLGLKVQHALRAFTAKDRTTIKRTAQNYPITPFYNVEELITSLGIGEALVTALSEKGTPTPLAHTLLRAPASRMDILSPLEIDGLVARSALARTYNEVIDRESAFELLEKRMKDSATAEVEDEKPTTRKTTTAPKEVSTIEKMTKNTMVRQVGNTLMRELARGLLGVLGLKSTTRRRR
ncbi:MAG: helicase HerA-like domain-containing protein [Flavobacteriales bacterium]